MFRGNETGWAILIVVACTLGLGWWARSHPLKAPEAVSGGEVPLRPAPNSDPWNQGSNTPDGYVIPPHSDPDRPNRQVEYPPESKARGEEGTVVVLLTINEQGRCTYAELDKSSGYPLLDQAVLDEAVNWRLVPGTVNGEPRTMRQKFAVTFKVAD